MKSADAAMYATVMTPVGTSTPSSWKNDAFTTSSAPAPEHLQHALRDEEAAGDVDHRHEDRHAAERGGRDVRGGAVGRVQQSADEDDAADGVRDAHERRVQRRRHVPDHLV